MGSAMQFEETQIPDVKIVTPIKHGDHRGFFSEVYKFSDWEKAGLIYNFVQDNHSYSAPVGTLRGLHFQIGANAQDKLVRVVRGSILDVVVDIRRSSPSFGQHVAVELSAESWRQLFIPIGFAHGFITLQPDTEVIYKVTAPYSSRDERGLAYDDPDLAISWPLPRSGAILSERDKLWPRLCDLKDTFK